MECCKPCEQTRSKLLSTGKPPTMAQYLDGISERNGLHQKPKKIANMTVNVQLLHECSAARLEKSRRRKSPLGKSHSLERTQQRSSCRVQYEAEHHTKACPVQEFSVRFLNVYRDSSHRFLLCHVSSNPFRCHSLIGFLSYRCWRLELRCSTRRELSKLFPMKILWYLAYP